AGGCGSRRRGTEQVPSRVRDRTRCGPAGRQPLPLGAWAPQEVDGVDERPL
ncbi:MAG: hypothetical protein AVDCRST_MAG16-2358, partial [uncultured Frankineae bacterium]